jgi:hypothetical protein
MAVEVVVVGMEVVVAMEVAADMEGGEHMGEEVDTAARHGRYFDGRRI